MTNPIYKVSAILTTVNVAVPRYTVFSERSYEVLVLYVDQLLPQLSYISTECMNNCSKTSLIKSHQLASYIVTSSQTTLFLKYLDRQLASYSCRCLYSQLILSCTKKWFGIYTIEVACKSLCTANCLRRKSFIVSMD